MTFDPLSIATPLFWYDPSDPSTITGTAAAVTALADKSGNARHLAVTGGTAPKLDVLGGRKALRFAGGNVLASPAFTQAQPITGFAVVQSAAASGGSFEDLVGTDTTAHGPGLALFLSTFAIGETVGGITGFAEDLLPHVFAGIWNGASSSLYQDLVLSVTGDAGSNGYASSKVTLGGDVNPEANLFNGWIGEVLYYAGALSSANRIAVENYLRAKWLRGGFPGFDAGNGISSASVFGFN